MAGGSDWIPSPHRTIPKPEPDSVGAPARRDRRHGFAVALLALSIVAAAAGLGFTAVKAQSGQPRGLGLLSGWVVDWDMESGIAEWRGNKDIFDELHLFGAYFDSNGSLALPGDWEPYRDEFESWRALGGSLWLTVVNDRLSATPGGSGRSVQKDPYVVQSLVLTAERRTRHIEDLLQLARDFGVDGIEIDYEQIGADDWPRYAEMIREAEQAFRAEGVGLQIVVEPAAGPIRHLDPILFPGPTVGPTVMSYNLFGLHSGPGPKNTPELIDRIVERIGADKVPRYRIAFATGGIEWVDGSGTRSFRESDAREILADSRTTLARGPDGHAHFAYTGDDGSRREVWFEDAVSFEHQWQAAADRGFTDLAIWRLGGNSPELFDLLRRIRTGAP